MLTGETRSTVPLCQWYFAHHTPHVDYPGIERELRGDMLETTIRAMARPLSVHARHNTHMAGTDFQTWPVEHDRALCDPSQAVCLDRSVRASWQRMTLTFHRNQYYNALMLTSSQRRHGRLSPSCFCPPPQYTHAIFVYFSFLFFPNSSRHIAVAPRTNYLILRHNHKPRRPPVYVWFSVRTALQSAGAYVTGDSGFWSLKSRLPKRFWSRPLFGFDNNEGSSHPCS